MKDAGVEFGFNTVANKTNLSDLNAIGEIARSVGAAEWQIFEYDSGGPNPSSKNDVLKLGPGQFYITTEALTIRGGDLKVVAKDLQARTGVYFLVDDSGLAWKPIGEGFRKIFGHIAGDREQVLLALRSHIEQLE